MSRRIPTYLRVSDQLRSLIQSADGERIQLPTEAELVEQFSISRQTARRAYQDLETDGLIERTPGRGTFSVPQGAHPVYQTLGAFEDLLELSVDTDMRVVSPLTFVELPDVARKLKTDESMVAGATLIRLHRDETFCFSEIAVPVQLGERILEEGTLPTEGSITFAGILDDLVPGGVGGAIQEVKAVACSRDLAITLGVAVDSPILRAERLYYDKSGSYVGWALTSYSPTLYTYQVDLRRRSAR